MVTDRRLLTALEANGGLVTLTARQLGITPQAIHRRAARKPKIRQAILEAREAMLDEAEQQLRAAIGRGEPWAVCFALKTIGRSRGYIERSEMVHTTDAAMSQLTDEELEAAIRRVAASTAAGSNGVSP